MPSIKIDQEKFGTNRCISVSTMLEEDAANDKLRKAKSS
ncbi:hypothetical protein SP21_22 [Salmonella phage 21]|nr:hypothetical protein SP21_22 [Salmonella phage 21]